MSTGGRPRHAVIDPVAGFTKTAPAAWAAKQLEAGTDVDSNGLGAFRVLEEAGHAHTVLEGSGRARCEQESARWVNVVLSHIKYWIEAANKVTFSYDLIN
jgi:hypothetical protein